MLPSKPVVLPLKDRLAILFGKKDALSVQARAISAMKDGQLAGLKAEVVHLENESEGQYKVIQGLVQQQADVKVIEAALEIAERKQLEQANYIASASARWAEVKTLLDQTMVAYHQQLAENRRLQLDLQKQKEVNIAQAQQIAQITEQGAQLEAQLQAEFAKLRVVEAPQPPYNPFYVPVATSAPLPYYQPAPAPVPVVTNAYNGYYASYQPMQHELATQPPQKAMSAREKYDAQKKAAEDERLRAASNIGLHLQNVVDRRESEEKLKFAENCAIVQAAVDAWASKVKRYLELINSQMVTEWEATGTIPERAKSFPRNWDEAQAYYIDNVAKAKGEKAAYFKEAESASEYLAKVLQESGKKSTVKSPVLDCNPESHLILQIMKDEGINHEGYVVKDARRGASPSREEASKSINVNEHIEIPGAHGTIVIDRTVPVEKAIEPPAKPEKVAPFKANIHLLPEGTTMEDKKIFHEAAWLIYNSTRGYLNRLQNDYKGAWKREDSSFYYRKEGLFPETLKEAVSRFLWTNHGQTKLTEGMELARDAYIRAGEPGADLGKFISDDLLPQYEKYTYVDYAAVGYNHRWPKKEAEWKNAPSWV